MLNDDAIRDILGSDPAPPRVSMLHPLSLSFQAEQVVRLLEHVLASGPDDLGVRRPELTPMERLRCLDLLEWARGASGVVSVSMYPTVEDGLEDLDEWIEEDGFPGNDLEL